MRPSGTIPVARPLLPKAVEILPYIEQIDQSRIYANFGPLTERFEARLASQLGLERDQIVSAANCTLALAAVLSELTHGGGGRCYLPSWTFCASAHAARLAGLEPFFLDVDPLTWQIDPETVDRAGGSFGPKDAVMAVAPFGSPVDPDRWDAFTARTGVPVVIDAASAFASQKAGSTPAVVSLHATKVLGVGEGAFVMCRAAALVQRVKRAMNFGFAADRTIVARGMNAKLPEISAAVGLAALDAWSETQARWRGLLDAYQDSFSSAGNLMSFNQRHISSTLVVTFAREMESPDHKLRAQGIETRRWWSGGCHREEAFRACLRTELPATEAAAASSIGLPFYLDMAPDDVARVGEAVLGLLAA